MFKLYFFIIGLFIIVNVRFSYFIYSIVIYQYFITQYINISLLSYSKLSYSKIILFPIIIIHFPKVILFFKHQKSIFSAAFYFSITLAQYFSSILFF